MGRSEVAKFLIVLCSVPVALILCFAEIIRFLHKKFEVTEKKMNKDVIFY
jgi:hypothetical protein